MDIFLSTGLVASAGATLALLGGMAGWLLAKRREGEPQLSQPSSQRHDAQSKPAVRASSYDDLAFAATYGHILEQAASEGQCDPSQSRPPHQSDVVEAHPLDALNMIRARANAIRLTEDIWSDPESLRAIRELDPDCSQVLERFRQSIDELEASNAGYVRIVTKAEGPGARALDEPTETYPSSRLADTAPLARNVDVGALSEARRRARLAQPSSLSTRV